MKAGIECYMSRGTAEALKLTGHRLHIIDGQFQVGAWTILPFKTIHDAAEPLGFLMARGDVTMLYVTDTQYIPHRFGGLTHILVECNYSMAIVNHLKATGGLDRELWRRIINSIFTFVYIIAKVRSGHLNFINRETWIGITLTNS